MTAQLTVLQRTPTRAVLIDQIGPNRWQIAAWGACAHDMMSWDVDGSACSYALACHRAVELHRRTGVPVGLRRLGARPGPFHRGVSW